MTIQQNINLDAFSEALNDKVDKDGYYGFPTGEYLDISSIVPIDGVAHTYTAPANGFIFVTKRAAANSQYVGAYDDQLYAHYEVWGTTDHMCNLFLPLRKGQSIIIRGNASGSDFIARFIYAST